MLKTEKKTLILKIEACKLTENEDFKYIDKKEFKKLYDEYIKT